MAPSNAPDHRRDFCTAFDAALNEGTFIKLTLGHYKGGDETLKSISIKKVLIKREEKLSVTYRHKTRDIVKNYTIAEGRNFVAQWVGEDFFTATLFTTAYDLVYDRNNKKSPLRQAAPSQTERPSLAHDRSKARLIAAGTRPWLHALGITDANGKVLNASQDKYRQINRYIEILRPLLDDLPAGAPLKIVDMGSGKGYLTFALYDYLAASGLDAEVTGIEYRRDLVELCNSIATESGMAGLRFQQGSIADYQADRIDVLIALHACDTATDDAIFQGISAKAALIVVAPCCHKQIRRDMEAGTPHSALAPMLRHGIFLEREAEMVTDALRGLYLDYAGFNTKIIEFIGGEHTPKNILIIGTRRGGPGETSAVLQKIEAMKAHFGVKNHYLGKKLGLENPE